MTEKEAQEMVDRAYGIEKPTDKPVHKSKGWDLKEFLMLAGVVIFIILVSLLGHHDINQTAPTCDEISRNC